MKRKLGWRGSENSEEKVIFKKFLGKMMLLLMGVLGVLGCATFFGAPYFMPIDKNDKSEILIEIPINTSAKTIGAILESKGIVKNGDVFYYYARLKGDSQKFQAGTYTLNKAYSLPRISKELGEGKLFAETYKVTIPEGYTIEGIAELLESKKIVSKSEFLKAINDENFKRIEMLRGIQFPVDAKYFLEGLLFPKTYEFSKFDTTIEIIQKMLTQTWTEIPEQWLTDINNQGKTLYEILIMASIIEKEVVAPEERAKVAGVYYNRIKDGMKLQADATVQFALGKHKERVMYSDLKIDSPYNTYKYQGMPPTPISNSGIEAIKAAIYPEQHNYYYYVTKKDGTGQHYFSTTYEEHLKNIELSKQ